MAAPIEACTKEEQRSVICFLVSEGVKPIKIHRHMVLQYSKACLSLQQVYEWSRKFKIGMSSVADTRLDQAHRVITPQAISEVERVIRENCHVMLGEVATMLDISHGSTHYIIYDMLQFHKVSARWVPRQLTLELMERRVDACQELATIRNRR
jgi:hypothetical protein